MTFFYFFFGIVFRTLHCEVLPALPTALEAQLIATDGPRGRRRLVPNIPSWSPWTGTETIHSWGPHCPVTSRKTWVEFIVLARSVESFCLQGIVRPIHPPTPIYSHIYPCIFYELLCFQAFLVCHNFLLARIWSTSCRFPNLRSTKPSYEYLVNLTEIIFLCTAHVHQPASGGSQESREAEEEKKEKGEGASGHWGTWPS